MANSNKPLRAVALVGLVASARQPGTYAMPSRFAIGVLHDSVAAHDGRRRLGIDERVQRGDVLPLVRNVGGALRVRADGSSKESQQRPLYYIAYESNSSVVDQYRDSLNVV